MVEYWQRAAGLVDAVLRLQVELRANRYEAWQKWLRHFEAPRRISGAACDNFRPLPRLCVRTTFRAVFCTAASPDQAAPVPSRSEQASRATVGFHWGHTW